jgi:type III secretion system low calcium response chaperone LcrH/SycD
MSKLYPLPANGDEEEPEMSEQNGLTAETINTMIAMISQGLSLKEVYGISDRIMNTIYAHGYEFYQTRRFDEAQTIFQFLYTHDIYNTDYMMGLAAVYQQKKNHAKAINLYALAYELDNKNGLALLYSGQCYLFLNEKEKALHCFAEFLDTDAKDGFKKQARTYLKTLQSEKNREVENERN